MRRQRGKWAAVTRRLGIHVDRVSDGAHVVQRGGERLEVIRVGDDRRSMHLLAPPALTQRGFTAIQKQLWEFFAAEQVTWLLRACRVNLVLDVGANKGQFATRLREAGYRGQIASFEPSSEPFRTLARVSAEDPKWTVHNMALGSEEGTAELHVAKGPLSSLQPANEFGKEWRDSLADTHTEQVQVRTLKAMFEELTADLDAPRVFLKMDTQGFDHEVFAGAGDALSSVVGLQSELSSLPIYEGAPRLTDQLEVYEQAGFEVVGIYPVGRDRRTMRVIEFDLVMLRPGEIRRRRA